MNQRKLTKQQELILQVPYTTITVAQYAEYHAVPEGLIDDALDKNVCDSRILPDQQTRILHIDDMIRVWDYIQAHWLING